MWLVFTFGPLFRWIPQPNPLKAKSCLFKKQQKNATKSDGPRVSVVVLEASFSLDSATKSVKSSVPTEFSKTLFHYRNLGS